MHNISHCSIFSFQEVMQFSPKQWHQVWTHVQVQSWLNINTCTHVYTSKVRVLLPTTLTAAVVPRAKDFLPIATVMANAISLEIAVVMTQKPAVNKVDTDFTVLWNMHFIWSSVIFISIYAIIRYVVCVLPLERLPVQVPRLAPFFSLSPSSSSFSFYPSNLQILTEMSVGSG